MPAPLPIEVTASQQRELKRIVNAKTSSQRDVFRARIIFLAQGLSHEEIAQEQSVSLLAIGRWRKRWAAKGLEGLQDASGRGRKPRLSAKALGRALPADTKARGVGKDSRKAHALGSAQSSKAFKGLNDSINQAHPYRSILAKSAHFSLFLRQLVAVFLDLAFKFVDVHFCEAFTSEPLRPEKGFVLRGE